MKCPNCEQPMQVSNFDNEIVLHCTTCGSSFFDLNGIRHISPSSARKIAEDAQGHYVLGNKKLCPKDHSELAQKMDDPALPANTVLLECPTCHGVFAYPDDLLKYKGVREPAPLSPLSMKLLPAPKTIFMLSLFAFLSLGVMMNYGAISNNFSIGSKADETIKKVVILSDDKKHYLFFDFITESAFTSQVRFNDRTDGRQIIKKVSTEPKKVHHLVTSDLDLSHDITYQIILGDSNPTAEKKLELK
jgi:uncharacterized C2H2 Zn-finger protein